MGEFYLVCWTKSRCKFQVVKIKLWKVFVISSESCMHRVVHFVEFVCACKSQVVHFVEEFICIRVSVVYFVEDFVLSSQKIAFSSQVASLPLCRNWIEWTWVTPPFGYWKYYLEGKRCYPYRCNTDKQTQS